MLSHTLAEQISTHRFNNVISSRVFLQIALSQVSFLLQYCHLKILLPASPEFRVSQLLQHCCSQSPYLCILESTVSSMQRLQQDKRTKRPPHPIDHDHMHEAIDVSDAWDLHVSMVHDPFVLHHASVAMHCCSTSGYPTAGLHCCCCI
jgi:hypothetical protein